MSQKPLNKTSRPYWILTLTTLFYATQSRAETTVNPTSPSTPTAVPAAMETPKPTPPTLSQEELDRSLVLWNSGMEAFLARRYPDAIASLSQYLEKFPGQSNALEARFYLGQSYLFGKKPDEAVKKLQSYIEAAGKHPQVNEARIYLGTAYLDLKKNTEAYLVSEELLSQPELPTTLRAKSLMLRAHAQSGLKQNVEAEKTLSVFQSLAERDPELEQELATSYLVTLFLKANHCDRLPSAKALQEDQVLDQLGRKGLCILEMGNQLARASRKLAADELKSGVEAVEMSWKNLIQACQAPPLERGKKSKTQWAKAKQELAIRLRESCESTTKLLKQSLSSRENLKDYLNRFTMSAANES